MRISNAEVRLPTFAPGAPAGLLTGNIDYQIVSKEISFNFAGAGIPLEAIGKFRRHVFPSGAGSICKSAGKGRCGRRKCMPRSD